MFVAYEVSFATLHAPLYAMIVKEKKSTEIKRVCAIKIKRK